MKKQILLLYIFTLSAIVCLGIFPVYSQETEGLEIKRTETGKIYFARFKPSATRKIQDAPSFLKTFLQAKADDELRLVKESTDALGMTHRRYQQYYKGIKVEDAEYLTHGKNETIETVNGDFQEVTISTVSPSLSEKTALSKSLGFINAKKYSWEDETAERFIKQNTKNFLATYFPKGELVITRDFLKGGKSLRLAWKFKISSVEPNNAQFIYVDAVSGEVIRTTSLIYDVNTPCVAQTLYSGTVGITGDSFIGGFRLQENRNNVTIRTLNCLGQSNYAAAVEFTNNNTNWTLGNWTAIGQDQAALDAHWGAENVLDYWRIVHNRNSIDGNGLPVTGYVHFFIPNDAHWPNNAQWDDNNNVIRYGDGDGFFFNRVTALDVSAHEIGHGICQYTANLIHNNQESGALNEGFSDIWGACVEHWAAPAKQTWLIGEEVLFGLPSLRSMSDPNTGGGGACPDTYHGTFWDNGGETHTNSTVLSHWFFLLSEGGSGTNDIGNAFTVNGIGINDAQFIAFRTESVYLNSTATYATTREASIQAARDLFGTGSCQEIAVTNAWHAVGVGAAVPTLITIDGNNVICSGNSLYTLNRNGTPVAGTVSWSSSNTSIATVSATGNPATVTMIGTGIVTITATGTVCGGNQSVSRNVILGSPTTITELIEDKVNNGCVTETSTYTAVGGTGATNYKWYLRKLPATTYTLMHDGPENSFGFTLPIKRNCTDYFVKVEARNDCNTNTPIVYTYQSQACACQSRLINELTDQKISITPNPATSMARITLSPVNKTTGKEESFIQQVRITDKSGNLKKIYNYKDKQLIQAIDISSLRPDIYNVSVYDGHSWQTVKLMVQ